jgi:TonB family protein
MKKTILTLACLFSITSFIFANGFCYSGDYTSGADKVHVHISTDGVLESGFYYVKAEFTIPNKPDKTIKTTFFCKTAGTMLYFGKSSDEISMDSPDGNYTDTGFKWTNSRFLFYKPASTAGVVMRACAEEIMEEVIIMEVVDDGTWDQLGYEGDAEIAITDVAIEEVTPSRNFDGSLTFICDGQTHPGQVLDFAEESPFFPGGEAAMVEYIRAHLIYPEQAKEQGIQGTVYVQFIVLADGSLCDVRVVRGISGLDAEAIRVTSAMPKWVPGKDHGSDVAVRFTLPINFRIR